MKIKKINTEILNSDLVKFMKIKELKFPSINRVLNRFEIMYEKEIKLLINKIYWIYTKNNIDRDEIKNQLLLSVWEIMTQKEFPKYKNFEGYFWSTLKLKLLNKFNRQINRQYDFESRVSYNKMNLSSLNARYQRINVEESKKVSLNEVNSLLDDQEKYLLNCKINFIKPRISSWKQKEMMQNIKTKTSCLFI
ncbi:hypothetical protein [Mycoplasmopsis cynos]|uniref:Uncharacterized protein n=3 Tax=Mycoplasmopsis cynos TaxID=171284 RepID=A0A449AJ13_9BACT|nr:hypothetical protein [Mycoplasmopsis cynos]MCU9932835.1 hypothetical protein [Mycoplasmopsis cynos]UWV77766.1 hypothetical protein NW070_02570 [Mycoplasmopsis cynos]WAM11297.1 hypothetical protein ONA00_02350 [Mycoplasmopsis cynos]WQQ13203.1 hypothetical protein RRG58_00430 [Mycoplasmopsis cynos]WQQ13906.1 hypothetical protein RRG52_04090 [Mycoplasmopsis cynos]